MSVRGGTPLVAFYGVFNAARGVSFFLLPLYFVSVGIQVIEVGVAVAAFGVSVLLFEILWGFIFDRVGPGRLVFVAVLATALVYALVPAVKTVEGAVAIEFLLGFTAPIFAVVARSMVIHGGESSGWARGFGLMGAVYALGLLAGSLLSSLAAPKVGIPGCFYAAGAVMVTGYLVYHWVSRRGEPLARVDNQLSAQKSPGRPRLDWRGLPLLGAVAVPAFIGFAFFTSIIQLVVTQTPRIGGTEFDAGVVVSAFWLSNGILQPTLASRGAVRARFWIAVSLLGSFLVFALMTQFYSVWELTVAAFLGAACLATVSPLSLSLLMVGIPKRYVGRAMGIYGAMEDTGLIIGPVLGSTVWIEFGLDYAYLIIGVTYLIVLVPFLLGMRGAPSQVKE